MREGILPIVITLAVAVVAGNWAHGEDASASEKPLRLYTFDSVSADSGVAESTGTESEPLKYSGSDKLEVVAGRRPDTKAVRLDNGAFQGKPFAPSERGCTVEIWFRKAGQGKQLGNGRTNGMIFCQGSGYWDGMRLSTSYPDRQLGFEIGRPKPANSISARSDFPVPDGVWNHVAVTWDRAAMSIYWNGLLMAIHEYGGDWTPATSFRIGYAGSESVR